MNNKTTPKTNTSNDRFSSLSEEKGNPFLQQTKKYEKKNNRWGDLKSEPEEYNNKRFNNDSRFNNYPEFNNNSRFSNQEKRNNFKKPTYHRRPFFIPSNKNGVNKEPEKREFTFNDNDFPDLSGINK